MSDPTRPPAAPQTPACPVCHQATTGWTNETMAFPARPVGGAERKVPGGTKIHVQPCGCLIRAVDQHQDKVPDPATGELVWGPILTVFTPW